MSISTTGENTAPSTYFPNQGRVHTICDPVTIAVTMAVVSTAASVVGEIQSAKVQKRAISDQLAVQQGEILKAETAELNDRQRTARREQARIKVAAGQAGLNIGGSVEAMLNDSLFQNSLAAERTKLNADSQQNAAVAEANAMYSRINEPTLLSAGLRIGTSAAQGYSSGKSLQIQKQNASKGPQ